jgi:hypothetical protein
MNANVKTQMSANGVRAMGKVKQDHLRLFAQNLRPFAANESLKALSGITHEQD